MLDALFQSSLLSHFAAECTNNSTFLGLEPWYHYLNVTIQNGTCQISGFTLLGNNSSLLLILLALIDDLLRIAGTIAVFVVIYAGIKYVTSSGSPDKTGEAQGTLINALIGLAIAMIAIQFVSFLGNRLAGTAGSGGTASVGGAQLALPIPSVTADKSLVQTILTILFGVTGALSFMFLVFGGLRYVLSRGDPQAIGKAKGTIIYALIGVAVAILGQTIVSFIINRFGA